MKNLKNLLLVIFATFYATLVVAQEITADEYLDFDSK